MVGSVVVGSLKVRHKSIKKMAPVPTSLIAAKAEQFWLLLGLRPFIACRDPDRVRVGGSKKTQQRKICSGSNRPNFVQNAAVLANFFSSL